MNIFEVPATEGATNLLLSCADGHWHVEVLEAK